MDRIRILAQYIYRTLPHQDTMVFCPRKSDEVTLDAARLMENFILTHEHLHSLPELLFWEFADAIKPRPGTFSMEKLFAAVRERIENTHMEPRTNS